MLVGAGLCGGDAIAWLNETLRHWLAEFGISTTADEIWKYLATVLDRDSDQEVELKCQPFFSGTRPDPQRRAMFGGIGRGNFTPVNIARSIFSGIADTMKSVYDQAGNQRPVVLKRVVMSGNASRRNPSLVKAIEKAFGMTVELVATVEEAAVGGALLAGSSVGIWPDVETARAILDAANPRSNE